MPNTMQAFRMVHWQEPPVLEEIEVPEPGPGEVRIKVAGNGLCQSDLHMPHIPAVMEELMGAARLNASIAGTDHEGSGYPGKGI